MLLKVDYELPFSKGQIITGIEKRQEVRLRVFTVNLYFPLSVLIRLPGHSMALVTPYPTLSPHCLIVPPRYFPSAYSAESN